MFFIEAVTIDSLKLKLRSSTGSGNIRIRLFMSDGQTEDVTLQNSNSVQRVKLDDSRETSFVTMEIMETDGNAIGIASLAFIPPNVPHQLTFEAWVKKESSTVMLPLKSHGKILVVE